MAPNTTATTRPQELPRSSEEQENGSDKVEDPFFQNWWSHVIWKNVVIMSILHGVALYAFFFTPINNTTILTHIWSVFSGLVGGFGVTAGAHRLWTHRAFKAKTPLRIFLSLCYSMAGENTIYDWVRDHRVHHKFSETDADPHNAKRGFFFSHMGWLMMKKHPDVIRKGKQIDMSDILADPVVQLHTKYFSLLKLLFCFVLPVIVPHYLWRETWYNSFMLSMWRYVLMLNANWLVNSAAHIWGYRPYDKRINPAENFAVSFMTLGEGWHNYHHVFPWDYRAAELGSYLLNMTTFYLDLFAKMGLAYDLKCPSQELVKKVAERYGDGTHSKWGHHVQEVKEDEDPNKKILYPSADQLSESEEDLDKILADFSSTDSTDEEKIIFKADTEEHNSKLFDDGKISIDDMKIKKDIALPTKHSNQSEENYNIGTQKATSFVNGNTRTKSYVLSPGKSALLRNNFFRNFSSSPVSRKGRELIKSGTDDTINGVYRNDVLAKKVTKCDDSPTKLGNVNSSLTIDSSGNKLSPTKADEIIIKHKSPYDSPCEQQLCASEIRAVEEKDKKIL